MRDLVAVVEEHHNVAARDHLVVHGREPLDLRFDLQHAAPAVAAPHHDHRKRPVAARAAHCDRHVDLVARKHEREVHWGIRAAHGLRDHVTMRRQFGGDGCGGFRFRVHCGYSCSIMPSCVLPASYAARTNASTPARRSSSANMDSAIATAPTNPSVCQWPNARGGSAVFTPFGSGYGLT